MLKGLILQNFSKEDNGNRKSNIALTADDFNYQNFNETLLNLDSTSN